MEFADRIEKMLREMIGERSWLVLANKSTIAKFVIVDGKPVGQHEEEKVEKFYAGVNDVLFHEYQEK